MDLKEPECRNPADVLKNIFGYTNFRGQQEEIISHVIEGNSACVLMPTGAGKSLCYQIPALCRPGVGIIISPLIALMQDQVSTLRELGVRAVMLNSSMAYQEQQQTLAAIRAGEVDMVYMAPERLMTEQTLDLLDSLPLALIAIDEAHCLSQWGHDFRPEYRALSVLRTRFPDTPCLAVTATADEPTRQDILKHLTLEQLYVAGFDRPNIRYEVSVKENPKQKLLNFLKTYPDESGIIYCLSRDKTDSTAAWLQSKGFNALPYHAGLEKGIRAGNQERFLKEEGIIIVATIAFGMGIDKPDVRFVCHMDMPNNIEAYYQETGRAGRDGLPATAWMVYGLQDVAKRRHMIENSNAPDAQKRVEHHKLSALLGYCEAASCRRRILLNYFGDAGGECGNCDICLNPPETIDGIIPAQKILSCIYRTGQVFGAAHIADVLLGKTSEQIMRHGHESISTYGIGTEYDRKTWQSLIRQLVSRNLIRVDVEGYGGLKFTAEGVAFLKQATALSLILPRRQKLERSQSAPAVEMLENEADRELFQKLKALRLSIAKENNLPPYVIFHDKTLMAMAVEKPQHRDAFAVMPGVGASKLEKYASAFLDVILAEAA
jgi:ATP-dependent DNA helicase RecQ